MRWSGRPRSCPKPKGPKRCARSPAKARCTRRSISGAGHRRFRRAFLTRRIQVKLENDCFGADKDMGGDYFGYDGPCPPWNDSIVHHYVFTLYALDVARLALQGNFKGPDVLGAMRRHVLGQASVTGLYSLNPAVPV